ncbi:CRISPR-associated protein Cas4 [Sporolactobacillus terrae]|uniref:CRISPR-associated protein Cas4 n=1 Tax=Sporolactobacillus terrae TaxID=269673 RepID=UPI00048DEFB7|nr:CRISPR-associated protein Cas4 [Sporolactobacillus terrae]
MKADNEEDYLMLSGIQHFQFCKRQWALIHIEQQWEENVRTIEGQFLHRKADQPFIREKRGSKLIVRAMPVKSKILKITGICDVVEFVRDDKAGVSLNGLNGKYLPYPIEYKHGKPKIDDSDILQLTAQAICLEEMLLCTINKGFIFYNELKHRIPITFNEGHRKKVQSMVAEMQDYYRHRYTPKVRMGKFCRSCSLQDICLPKLMKKQSVKRYIEGNID